MTYNVFSGTLNPTHSLTQQLTKKNNNRNPFNSPLSRSTQVNWFLRKCSLARSLSLWVLFSVFKLNFSICYVPQHPPCLVQLSFFHNIVSDMTGYHCVEWT